MSVFSASTCSRVRLPSDWRTAICNARYRYSLTSFNPARAVVASAISDTAEMLTRTVTLSWVRISWPDTSTV